jgi:hypothetical protein
VLPGGIPIDTTWAALGDAYGEAASGTTETGVLQARFDTLPGFTFVLEVDPRAVGAVEATGDFSKVPPDARIIGVFVRPRGGPGEH